MYADEELLPVSALQHLLFCERRAVLIHVEAAWEDNVFTAEGSLLHAKTHGAEAELRRDVRVVRGLLLRSLALGLCGKADVVEFHRVPNPDSCGQGDGTPRAVALPGVPGLWVPYPVEYKRGRLRHELGYEVQLCAQAMCLEEMLGVDVTAGALYYGAPRRRLEIVLGPALRDQTRIAAARLHQLVGAGITPAPHHSSKCRSCSLAPSCLPKPLSSRRSAFRYVQRRIDEARQEGSVPGASPP